MLPTFASYGSDADGDTHVLTRPLLVKTKRARAGLALLSATLVMTSGAGVYGMLDTSGMCHTEGAVLDTTNLAAILPTSAASDAGTHSQPPPHHRSLLTTAQSNQTTEQLFDRVDVDGSGSVNLTEVVAYLERERDDTIHVIESSANAAIKAIKDEYFHQARCLADGFNSVVPEGGVLTAPDELDLVVRWVQQHCVAFFPSLVAVPTTTSAPADSNEADAKVFSRDEIIAFVKAKTSSGFFLQCTLDALDEFPSTKQFTRRDVDGILRQVLQCLSSWLLRCKNHKAVFATNG